MGKKSYDVKYVVYEHECLDVGIFGHKKIKLFNPDEKEDAFKFAEELNEKERRRSGNLRYAKCCLSCCHHGVDESKGNLHQCRCPSHNRTVYYTEVCDDFKPTREYAKQKEAKKHRVEC